MYYRISQKIIDEHMEIVDTQNKAFEVSQIVLLSPLVLIFLSFMTIVL